MTVPGCLGSGQAPSSAPLTRAVQRRTIAPMPTHPAKPLPHHVPAEPDHGHEPGGQPVDPDDGAVPPVIPRPDEEGQAPDAPA